MNLLTLRPRASVSTLLALAAFLVAGCAVDTIHTGVPRTTATHTETPISTNFPTTTQPKLQAGQHWINIADDTGRAVTTILRSGRFCPPKPGNCSPVYVKPAEVVTGFSRAFHNQLITTLVNQGVMVSKVPDTELSVDVDVQPVLFSPNRPQYRYAGVPVQLAPGVWGLRDVVATDPANPGIVPPAPDALHWFRSQFAAGETPRAEILVTVSIGDRHRYLSRSTNAYYIADTDQRLYDEELCALFKLCAADKGSCGCTTGGGNKGGCNCPGTTVMKVAGDCPIDKPCPSEAVAVAAPAPAPVKAEAPKAKAKGKK